TVKTEFSPRDALKGPQIRPGVRPEGPIGGVPPTAATLLHAASRSHRPEGPESHQVIGGHRGAETPADAVASSVSRLATQPHGLQPPEHVLDALPDPLADAVAGMARGPRGEHGRRLLRAVRGHGERANACDAVPIVVVRVSAAGRAAAPRNLLRHRPRGRPLRAAGGAGEAAVHHEPVPILRTWPR